jgi:hypothetical protein
LIGLDPLAAAAWIFFRNQPAEQVGFNVSYSEPCRKSGAFLTGLRRDRTFRSLMAPQRIGFSGIQLIFR